MNTPDTSSWTQEDWRLFLKQCPYGAFYDFFDDNSELAWVLGDALVLAQRCVLADPEVIMHNHLKKVETQMRAVEQMFETYRQLTSSAISSVNTTYSWSGNCE